MSLILEALKRSESERIAKSQDANSLVTSGISAGSDASEKKPLIPFLIAALVINLIVLTIFLLPKKTSTPALEAVGQTAKPVIDSTSSNSDLAARVEAVEQRINSGPRLTLEMPTAAEMPPPKEVKAATALAEELLAATRPTPPVTHSVENYDVASIADENNAAPAVPAEFAMLDTEEIQASEPASQTPPTLRELNNTSLADQLANYEINTHIFNSNDAARSFVLINMKKYREGDTLQGSNFTIASITNEGVVINHDAGQVLLSND